MVEENICYINVTQVTQQNVVLIKLFIVIINKNYLFLNFIARKISNMIYNIVIK